MIFQHVATNLNGLVFVSTDPLACLFIFAPPPYLPVGGLTQLIFCFLIDSCCAFATSTELPSQPASVSDSLPSASFSVVIMIIIDIFTILFFFLVVSNNISSSCCLLLFLRRRRNRPCLYLLCQDINMTMMIMEGWQVKDLPSSPHIGTLVFPFYSTLKGSSIEMSLIAAGVDLKREFINLSQSPF